VAHWEYRECRDGWEPKVSFCELVAEMVAADLKVAERDQLASNSGHRVHSHAD
jgi:GDPmannose 4,6-dehydratase